MPVADLTHQPRVTITTDPNKRLIQFKIDDVIDIPHVTDAVLNIPGDGLATLTLTTLAYHREGVIFDGPVNRINMNVCVIPGYELIEEVSGVCGTRWRTQRSVDGWQPIATAPRDGSPFDVWLGDAEELDREFYCGDTGRFSPAWHWSRGMFRPKMGLQMPVVFCQPTHWKRCDAGPQ